jgi:hypothetical protein
VLAWFLADVDQLRSRLRVPQQTLRCEPVVDDNVSLFEALYALYCNETGITGAAADEVDQDSPPACIALDGPWSG